MESRTVEQCLRRYDELCKGGRPGKITTEEDVVAVLSFVQSKFTVHFGLRMVCF